MVAFDKTLDWPEASTRIEVRREEDLLFWSRWFRVSIAMLRQAVRIAGNRFQDVSSFLSRKRAG